tara:strand:- start:62 stop:304 length:243 start_codon:yes stop_codon:yes gene_type:complete
MSNPRYNKQSANQRIGGKGGRSFGRGQIEIPKAVEAGAITTKGIAPAKGKAEEISISKGQETGTALGMGAATKGGKYTWS